MNAHEIARVLDEVGRLMRFRGKGNPFKAKAYVEAAKTLRALGEPIDEVIAGDRLRDLPGIGPAIEKKIRVLHETGSLPLHEELKAEMPLGVLELSAVPGLGRTRARQAWEALGVESLDQLEAAAESGELATVPGFGPKTVAAVKRGVARARTHAGRVTLTEARRVAEALERGMAASPAVARVAVAGDVRRRSNVVGEIVLVAEGPDPAAVARAFERVAGEGRARLAVASAGAWGAALVAETGSAHHVEALAARAAERGMELSSAGLTRDGAPAGGATEEEVYEALGLAWIPPELREGRGEIEAAARGRLPALVERGDLRGALHVHTTWSDGRATVRAMAEKARELGFEYLAVCDHSRSAAYAGGLTLDRLALQRIEIDALNRELEGIRVLAGSEVDVRNDGELDWPDEALAGLDFVVASLHGGFSLPKKDQTRRVLKAIANPWVDVMGHPTGRILLGREGARLDMDAVLDAAATHGVALEVNGDPRRLDLDWTWHTAALERGIPLALGSDAHGPETLEPLTMNAVNAARKGGVESRHVLNARGLEEFEAALRRRRSG